MYVLGVLVLLGVYLFTNRKDKKQNKKQKRKILILFKKRLIFVVRWVFICPLEVMKKSFMITLVDDAGPISPPFLTKGS